jgi:RHS repeat-associated protein
LRYSDLAGTQKVGESDFTYDNAGRLTNLQHKNGGGTVLANYTYTYDLASRVLSETLNGSATTYAYDSTNQLTQAGTSTYSYDANGNRTSAGYQTGAGNQVTSDGSWTYSYDAEGNLVKKSKGSNAETWTYGYDNQNHLLWAKDQATDGGTTLTLATYSYDALGNRIEKDVWTQASGTTTVTRFAYDDQGNVWADLNSSNQLQTRRVYLDGEDQPAARVSGGAVAWYLVDRQGSVRDITDGSGAVQDHLGYDAFGRLVSESNAAFGDRYKYTGREYDSETGLQYNRARYYDAGTGRWTSQDPLGFGAGDANLYRYVGNHPTTARDPSGLVQDVGLIYQAYHDQMALTYGQYADSWSHQVGVSPEAAVAAAIAQGPALVANDNTPRYDLFKQFSNFGAGMGDKVSMGLTGRIRHWLGYDDVVDYHSGAYAYGGYAGTAVNTGLMFANPCAMSASLGMGVRVINGVQAVGGSFNAYEHFQDGHYVQGGLDALGVVGNAGQMLRACFLAGTPLLTPDGHKPIEQFRPGDLILSRSEFEQEREPEAKVVEEVFVRTGCIMTVEVSGRVIKTTAEHPFWVQGKGWLPAGELRVGDLLSSHDGRWVPVEAVKDTGVYETVYNLRIADYHTYFVGSALWGFSVWAHNTYGVHSTSNTIANQIEKEGKIAARQWVAEFPNTPEGLDAMEAHLSTGFVHSGAPHPDTSFIVEIDGLGKTGHIDPRGVQLADSVDLSTRFVARVKDAGNPDYIDPIMAELRARLPR